MRPFKVKHLDKYSAPTLEGVDYPSLGVEQAWNDKENGVLHLRTYTGERSAAGRNTTWRITNLPNAAEAVVIKNGERLNSVQVLDANTIRVETDIGMHQYRILTGLLWTISRANSARPDDSGKRRCCDRDTEISGAKC